MWPLCTKNHCVLKLKFLPIFEDRLKKFSVIDFRSTVYCFFDFFRKKLVVSPRWADSGRIKNNLPVRFSNRSTGIFFESKNNRKKAADRDFGDVLKFSRSLCNKIKSRWGFILLHRDREFLIFIQNHDLVRIEFRKNSDRKLKNRRPKTYHSLYCQKFGKM